MPQALGLVEELTVWENAALPSASRRPTEPADVDELLDRLGLTDLAHRPSTGTSLGEQQRTAIARALVARPHLLVADEPTAHQNAAWARSLLGELRTVCVDGGAVLVATHDRELLGAMDRVVTLHDGPLEDRFGVRISPDRTDARQNGSAGGPIVVGGLEDLAQVGRDGPAVGREVVLAGPGDGERVAAGQLRAGRRRARGGAGRGRRCG